MSYRTEVTPFTLLAAVTGLVLAAVSVDTASRFPLLLLGASLLGLTLTFLTRRAHEVERKFLLNLVLLAIAVRLVLFAVIRLTTGPYIFAPDQLTYEIVGMEVVGAWSQGLPLPRHATEGLQAGYYLFNAFIFRLFGEARAAPAIFNVYMGAWLPVALYALVQRVVAGNHGVARLAALLAAFFPSLVLWSVLNVREAPTILALVMIVYGAVRIQDELDIWGALSLLFGAAVLAGSREYLMILVCGSAATGLLVRKGRAPALSILTGITLLFLLMIVLQTSGIGGTLVSEPSLERIQALRADLAIGASSAYGLEHDISTVTGALAFLPTGFSHFVFAPFPWTVTSLLQLVTLPETLLWYAIFPFVIRGAYLGLRYDPRGISVVLSVLFVVVLGYSLVEGNVGTAFRHRAQVLPLFFVLAAIGLRDAYGLWRQRLVPRPVRWPPERPRTRQAGRPSVPTPIPR